MQTFTYPMPECKPVCAQRKCFKLRQQSVPLIFYYVSFLLHLFLSFFIIKYNLLSNWFPYNTQCSSQQVPSSISSTLYKHVLPFSFGLHGFPGEGSNLNVSCFSYCFQHLLLKVLPWCVLMWTSLGSVTLVFTKDLVSVSLFFIKFGRFQP